MINHAKKISSLLAALLLFATVALTGAIAQDLVHAISGVVKDVDKGTKTVVIKTADGTDHTFKYTAKTTVAGVTDAGKGVDTAATDTALAAKKGAKVTVEYTGKGAQKTATGIKDAVD
jgi:hypothetical protein